jgi:hypothetical protein
LIEESLRMIVDKIRIFFTSSLLREKGMTQMEEAGIV